ncbi:MAG: polysaccharide deacetylase family protein [Alphaproteobacteria bacterium]|nr:polysaccharide deacetylase family protein [Alphaproteobacteria bacterium]
MKLLLIRLCFATALFTVGIVPVALASDTAVILMYHRFGESHLPTTNTTVAQLEDHIAALQDGGYTVVPLADVVSALNGEHNLPPRAIAITVDDAYRSFLTTGWPRFKAAGFPVTLFVATEGVDAGYSDTLTWNEILTLQRDGVVIGAHSHNHSHFPSLSAATVAQDLAEMSAAFERALGDVPDVFAYPYGEAGRADMTAVRNAGFVAGFGQHSGAVGPLADRFYLPRFALNEQFGRLERFRLIIETLPLPVVSISPVDPVLQSNPPAITIELTDSLPNLENVTCFGPSGEQLNVVAGTNTVSVNPTSSFPAGRARLNCTLRSVDRLTQGRWYWYGWQMIAEFESEGIAVHPRYR